MLHEIIGILGKKVKTSKLKQGEKLLTYETKSEILMMPNSIHTGCIS